jgi:hypothetical protein
MHRSALHFGNENGVIARLAMVHELALEVGHGIIEQRDCASAARERNAFEAARLLLIGKAPAHVLVRAGHDTDAEFRMRQQ